MSYPLRPLDTLSSLSFGYLLLPNVIFALGWLRWPWVLALAGCWAWALWAARRRLIVGEALPSLRRSEIMILLLLAGVWAWLVGIGGWTPQKSDYDKHNLIFYDLITRSWPVVYSNTKYQDPLLCYYLAYYLPTAAIAKLSALPLAWADTLSFGWGWAGLFLTLAWLRRLAPQHGWWLAGGFLLLSGLEMPLRMLHGALTDGAALWEAATWQAAIKSLHRHLPVHFGFSGAELAHSQAFSPLIAQVQWAPQHALGAWVATGLFWGNRHRLPAATWWAVGVGLLLWSPFVAIGWVLVVFCTLGRAVLRHSGPLWWVVVASVAWAGVLVLYFESHWPLAYAGLITDAFERFSDVLLFVLYWGLQLWLPLWLALRLRPASQPTSDVFGSRTLLISALIIQLLAFGYVGKFNDWIMRTIIPAEMLFFSTLLCVWLRASRRRLSWWLLSTWLGIGALYSLGAIRQTLLAHPTVERSIPNAPRNFGEADISRMSRDARYPEVDFAAQYLGRRDSWFYRYLAK